MLKRFVDRDVDKGLKSLAATISPSLALLKIFFKNEDVSH